MQKVVDFTKTIYDLCTENPEIKEIMRELGFESITNPGMINTAGRIMTIPKGATMKGVELGKIRAEFEKRGYGMKE